MGFLDNIFKRKQEPAPAPVKEERGLLGGIGLTYGTFSTYANTKAMQLSTAYACTNIISDAVALLPLRVKKYEKGKMIDIEHPLKKILNLVPNKKYNHFDLFKLLIESVILQGNGYLYIEDLGIKTE